MVNRSPRTALSIFVLSALVLGAAGCEIAAYVDRSEIDENDGGSKGDADAAPACTSAAHCPTTANECIEATCDQGVCGTRVKKGDSCSSGVCDPSGKCLPAGCVDRVKNGTETDIDCGGPLCPPCADYLNCVQGSDCISKICDSLSRTCGA